MARKSRKNLPQPEQAAVSVLLPELEEAKIPAAIYGRLSVEDEETEESMETQIALVQDYINRSRELSYVDTYFDNGFTGTNFKRPAFTRLMNDVRQKKIKCIVVKDLSRFGRNYLEAGYYIETVFPFLGIRLIAVTDNFDSTRKEDMESLALPIRNMLNDENVPVPSVYNKENKAYGKETTYTIAPVILWDSSRVWKILTAYVYTGAMVLGKTKTLISGKSIVRTVPKGQQFITEGTHEAIVGREEFEKAQLVIKSNSHKVLMGGVDFPLKGKVRCGNCRRVMAHNFKQAVPTFWCREGLELVGQTQCTSEVFQVSDIENAVFQALKKELSLLDVLYGDIQKEEQGLKEAHKKASRRKTLMEQELKNLKGEKMRMYEEYAAGTLLLDTYKQKKQECDRRISEVQEQIEQSKVEESTKSIVPGTVRAAAEQAENFLNGTRLTASMVSAFIENVFVYDGGRIVVRFKYEQSIQDAVKALHTG